MFLYTIDGLLFLMPFGIRDFLFLSSTPLIIRLKEIFYVQLSFLIFFSLSQLGKDFPNSFFFHLLFFFYNFNNIAGWSINIRRILPSSGIGIETYGCANILIFPFSFRKILLRILDFKKQSNKHKQYFVVYQLQITKKKNPLAK